MTTTRQKQTPSNTEREQTDNGATTGYEAKLWQMADTLRGCMDAAEYKHVVLGPSSSSTYPMPSRSGTQRYLPNWETPPPKTATIGSKAAG